MNDGPGILPIPGYFITEEELGEAGFSPFNLRIVQPSMTLPGGDGCNWSTIGDVPEAPGLYAFTVETDKIAVTYVGMTEHLWMPL